MSPTSQQKTLKTYLYTTTVSKTTRLLFTTRYHLILFISYIKL